jgi:hypothetical protein
MINLQGLVNNHIQNLSPEQDGKVKSCYRTFMANVDIWDELSTYEKLPATRQIYDVIHSIKLITGLMTDEAAILKDSGRRCVSDHLFCPQAWLGDKMFVYPEFQDYEKFLQGFFLGTCVVEVTSAENDGNKLSALFTENFVYTHPLQRYTESNIRLTTERKKGTLNRQYNSLGELVQFPQFYDDAVEGRDTLRFETLLTSPLTPLEEVMS